MYVKNYKTKSKLSEPKNRKKAERSYKKSTKAMTDTKECNICSYVDDIIDCDLYKLQIEWLYLSFRSYYRNLKDSKPNRLNIMWQCLTENEKECKKIKVVKQCPKLRKLLNDYFAYRDNKIEANKLFSK